MPENSALIARRLKELADKVDHLDGRIKLRPVVRVLLGVALAMSLIGNVVALHAINDIVSVRNESRRTTCIKDRGFQLAHNRLTRSTAELVRVTFTASAAGKRTQADRESTLAFMQGRVAEIEKNIVAVRKCDKASIEGFYTPKDRR